MIEFLKSHETISKIIFASILFVLFIVAIIIAYKLEPVKTRTEKIKKYATIAIFSAFSVALFYLRIPFPIFTFLKIQFSNLPAYIIGLMLGPASGLMVVFIRTMICIPFTSSLCVGEVADLLIGSAAVLTSSIIYLKNKTKRQAGISLMFATVSWVVVAMIANYALLVPLYIQLYFNSNTTAFVHMLSAGADFINENNYMLIYMILGVIPFNSIISVASSIITFIVYKRISTLYKNIGSEEEPLKEDALN